MERRRQKVIRLHNSEERPLSEAAIVDATVAFANGARLDIDGLVPIDSSHHTGDEEIGSSLELIRKLQAENLLGHSSSDEPPAATVDEYRDRHRESLRVFMARAIQDAAGAAKQQLAASSVDLVRVKPLVRPTPKGLSLVHHYEFSTYADLVTLGSILLLDTRRGFLEKLCQCQLQSCGVFFFEKKPKTGRPARKYCGRAHMLRAHDENANARMARTAKKRRSKR